MKKEKYNPEKEERMKNIEDLRDGLTNVLTELEEPIENFLPNKEFLPSLDLEKIIDKHDYEKDLEIIKIESKETLECLANLYISEEFMKNKNIYKLIQNDASKLTELNFSISCSKRALVNCMQQLDLGTADPDMYQSVAIFQKEMRETIKVVYDMELKIKTFYKELKNEMPEINVGNEQIEIDPIKNLNIIGDPKKLNEIMEKYKKDPTLLK